MIGGVEERAEPPWAASKDDELLVRPVRSELIQ